MGLLLLLLLLLLFSLLLLPLLFLLHRHKKEDLGDAVVTVDHMVEHHLQEEMGQMYRYSTSITGITTSKELSICYFSKSESNNDHYYESREQ